MEKNDESHAEDRTCKRTNVSKVSPVIEMCATMVQITNTFFGGRNMINSYTTLNGYQYEMRIGFGTSIGTHCIVTGDVHIGAYCQLGCRISIRHNDHPTNFGTIYSNSRLLNGVASIGASEDSIRIGNDVWIGDSALILKGVNVGDGAIIGAGAVVTHSVPDYAIVVGNPAKIIKHRFDTELIPLFKTLAWWEYSFSDLEKFDTLRELFSFNIAADPLRAIKCLNKCIQEKRKLISEGAIEPLTDLYMVSQ